MTAERLDVAYTVEPVDVPCDAMKHAERPSNLPAEWVVWQQRCCPARPVIGLLCTECLDYIRTSQRPCRCPDCGHRAERLRDVVLHIERIDGRGPRA